MSKWLSPPLASSSWQPVASSYVFAAGIFDRWGRGSSQIFISAFLFGQGSGSSFSDWPPAPRGLAQRPTAPTTQPLHSCQFDSEQEFSLSSNFFRLVIVFRISVVSLFMSRKQLRFLRPPGRCILPVLDRRGVNFSVFSLVFIISFSLQPTAFPSPGRLLLQHLSLRCHMAPVYIFHNCKIYVLRRLA